MASLHTFAEYWWGSGWSASLTSSILSWQLTSMVSSWVDKASSIELAMSLVVLVVTAATGFFLIKIILLGLYGVISAVVFFYFNRVIVPFVIFISWIGGIIGIAYLLFLMYANLSGSQFDYMSTINITLTTLMGFFYHAANSTTT